MSYPNHNYRKPQAQEKTQLSPSDSKLLIIVIFLLVIGIMAIFSTTAQKAIEEGINPASYVGKQLFYLGLGVLCLNKLANTDYKQISKWIILASWLVIGLLLLVEFTPLGVMAGGAKRWLQLGPIQFQPSEFAKIAIVGLVSQAFCKDARIFCSEKVKYYIPIGIMFLLIILQPNLSMVALIGITCIIMFLTSGGSIKELFQVMSIVILVLPFFIQGYQMERIKSFFNRNADAEGIGYQVIQSKLAFAVGGLWGLGYGNSKQKLFWLPEAHTDFIFAIVGEEAGFLGCLLVIGLFCGLIHRGLIIASRCPDMFGKLMAFGITTVLGLQAMLNMGVTSSVLPATGVPLPFVSYGGTSLVANMMMIGILLNISKKRIKRINGIEERR